MSAALDVIIILTGLAYVSLAPYTKVEESFNLHATHDALFHGVRPAALHNYDHFIFPGAVPRTFVGSIILAWVSHLCLAIGSGFGMFSDKFDVQVIVRMVLAGLNAIGLCMLRRAVSRRFGRTTSLMFVLFTCTQFHLPFYMGRTLPNMFALLPANVALNLLVDQASNSSRPSKSRINTAIAILTFTTVVFRSELLLLLAPLALQAVVRYSSFYDVMKTGLISAVVSAAITVSVDSYFWQQWPLWPELYGIYFNVLQGKSSEWGVSPFHMYLTSHLPKLLLSSLPLSVFSCLLDPRIRTLMFPYISFIVLISGLAHKEWRFIIYVVPAFNIAAARSAAWLVGRRKGSLIGRLFFLAVPVMLLSNCCVTYLLARSSFANYPGGTALFAFNKLFSQEEHVHVHISNLAAQTGASLFLHSNAPPYLSGLALPVHHTNWTYDKTEDMSIDDLTTSSQITHLITEVSAITPSVRDAWTPIAVVDGFDGWEVDRDVRRAFDGGLVEGMRGLAGALEMVRTEKLVIVKRKV